MIAETSTEGMGLRLAELNGKIRARFDVRISTLPARTWRGYLASRPDLYEVDPKGPDAHVRLKRAGFGL